MRIKLCSIVGNRPQFIKYFALFRELELQGHDFDPLVINTWQHYDANLNEIFFSGFNIEAPTLNLNLEPTEPALQIAEIISKTSEIIQQERPHLVLVYGDTNTTLAGALAASKSNVPLAHIEAGCRSYNKSMSEEINRVLVDHMSHLLFAPNESMRLNLLRENITPEKIFVTGDLLEDVFHYQLSQLTKDLSVLRTQLGIPTHDYILLTFHRAENTDNEQRLRTLVNQLNRLSQDHQIVFPVHPRTEKMLNRFRIVLSPRILALKPIGYDDMIALERFARLIITDSGGVQREAAFLNKNCIIIRDETEWESLLSRSNVCLIGYGQFQLLPETALRLLESENPITTDQKDEPFMCAKTILQIIRDSF